MIRRAGAIVLLAFTNVAVAQTPAQLQHIRDLLGPDASTRWAVTRRMNPLIGDAIVCKDFATVEMLVSTIGNARSDRLMSAMTGGKTEQWKEAGPEPDPAAFGCATIRAGTRVRLESEGPPVISTDAVRGVTHPAMIEYETPKR